MRLSSSRNVIESGRHYRKRSKLRLGPSGIHLFDRVSGLNLLIEEVIPPEAGWAVAPRQVSIALTNACDLRCPYCFAPKTPSVLEFDRLISWLIELDTNGACGIGFGGGEPTLYPRFADLCAYTAQNTDLAVTFTTHGHHLQGALLESLKGNVHFVRVSMDGVGDTYERLRNRSFSALQKRLDSLRNIVPFGINFVVNKDTLPDIETAAFLAENAGASEFLILPEHPVNGRDGIDGETAVSLREWVNHYSGVIRLAITETDAEGMPTCNPLPHETGLRAYAHIDASGLLKRTSFDRDGVAIGSNGVMAALSQLQQETRASL
jgi:sulfatase maturation enzyme AslB (radical SAM superfamily)